MAKRQKRINPTRTVEPEVINDKKSSNLLAVKSKNYLNANSSKSKVFKKKWNTLRTYTEKELGIPKLNKSIDPEGVKQKGKKGKKFVNNESMMRILYSVNEKIDSRNASKLEKARQLEAIREAKRKEIEAKEDQKKELLEKKKADLKRRSKKDKSEKKPTSVKKQKSVSFS